MSSGERVLSASQTYDAHWVDFDREISIPNTQRLRTNVAIDPCPLRDGNTFLARHLRRERARRVMSGIRSDIDFTGLVRSLVLTTVSLSYHYRATPLPSHVGTLLVATAYLSLALPSARVPKLAAPKLFYSPNLLTC